MSESCPILAALFRTLLCAGAMAADLEPGRKGARSPGAAVRGQFATLTGEPAMVGSAFVLS